MLAFGGLRTDVSLCDLNGVLDALLWLMPFACCLSMFRCFGFVFALSGWNQRVLKMVPTCVFFFNAVYCSVVLVFEIVRFFVYARPFCFFMLLTTFDVFSDNSDGFRRLAVGSLNGTVLLIVDAISSNDTCLLAFVYRLLMVFSRCIYSFNACTRRYAFNARLTCFVCFLTAVGDCCVSSSACDANVVDVFFCQ